jgi:KaiC/GvpD/RAD55 family RecA-like ATPase
MSEQITGIPLPGDNDAAPSAPIFLQGDDWFAVDVKPYQLDFTKAYEAPQYTLSWNGIPFAPRGGIHAITGQAGNGKTMTLAQFMAAILCGEYGELRYELSDVIPHPKVLYIDTEMEEANTIAVKNRVMTLCERPINEDSDDFVVIMLREVPETADDKGKKTSSSMNRWRMTLKAIYEYKPTAVFIDGLLDVVADFNDNKECQEIIYKCMQVASHYNISVWCIVHQNPGGEKLVGHLGSFLERKVTDVFQTKKDKKDKTVDVTFTVSQKKARGRDVADWQFRVLPVDSWGRPEQILAAEIQRKGEKSEGDDPEKIKQWIDEAANRYEWPMSRGDIKRTVFGEIGGQLNHGKQDTDLAIAINLGYLEQSTLKKNGAYMLQPKLPF